MIKKIYESDYTLVAVVAVAFLVSVFVWKYTKKLLRLTRSSKHIS